VAGTEAGMWRSRLYLTYVKSDCRRNGSDGDEYILVGSCIHVLDNTYLLLLLYILTY